MRIITDSDGRVLDVSFGALISCGGQDGADYTGTVPTGYTSLEDWFIKEADKLYRWTVVDGELTLDSSAVAPTDKLPAADYVIEQGTSGIWTYRKWNSGVSECWGTKTGNLSKISNYFNFHLYAFIDIAFPTGLFINPPIAIPKMRIGDSGSGTIDVRYNGDATITKDKVNVYGISETATANQPCRADIYAIGTWK